MRKGLLVGCAVLGLWALACSDSPTGGEEPGVIGPAGGAVTLGTEARIEVPAGALSEEVLIRILPVATPTDLVTQGAIGQAYRFEPIDRQLAIAARITILVPPAVLAGRSLDRVTLLRSTSVTSALVPAGEELGSITRSSDGRVSGTTTRLGVFSAAILNRAPAADAGADQNVAIGTTVSLSGFGADPDGDPLTFSWEFVSRPVGSAATITNAASAIASFVPDQAGTYDVRLTVSDGQLSDSDDVRVTVTQQNRAPTLNVSAPDAVFVGGEAVITAAASDPDNDPVTVSFELLEKPPGGGDLIAVGTTVRFISSVAGIYRVRVRASDSRGGATQTDVLVGVNPHVDGSYEVTVSADATSCGQGQDVRTGTLPILQPSPGTVVLDLPGASSSFLDRATGRLIGEEFSFNGTIRIQSGSSAFPFTGSIEGTIQSNGQLNLLFNFAAPANFCRIPGTIVGTRN